MNINIYKRVIPFLTIILLSINTNAKIQDTTNLKKEKNYINIGKKEKLSESLKKISELKKIDYLIKGEDLEINSSKDIKIENINDLVKYYKIFNNVSLKVKSNGYNKNLPIYVYMPTEVKKNENLKEEEKIDNLKSIKELKEYLVTHKQKELLLSKINSKLIELSLISKRIDIAFLRNKLKKITTKNELLEIIKEVENVY